MATRQANKRLTREYLSIQASPPPYITAHPSETNILEWHYLLTGPPDTPYHNGQYWGTLTFPPEYPFKPPAIRMITPSGRFAPSTRLCLSISDFHPKSFNPAWEVSTILIGLLSFMTSEEMTTGSVRGSPEERKRYAARSKWWNSCGEKGRLFREQWPEVHAENLEWMRREGVDVVTGEKRVVKVVEGEGDGCVKRMKAAKVVAATTASGPQEVVRRGEGWVRRNRLWVGVLVVVGYVLLARALE